MYQLKCILFLSILTLFINFFFYSKYLFKVFLSFGKLFPEILETRLLNQIQHVDCKVMLIAMDLFS